jgi:hypothetical protein
MAPSPMAASDVLMTSLIDLFYVDLHEIALLLSSDVPIARRSPHMCTLVPTNPDITLRAFPSIAASELFTWQM